MRPLIVAAALLSLAGSVPAATLLVPSEYATIQSAIDLAAAGDTVLVAPGLYEDADVRDSPRGPRKASVFLRSDVFLRSKGGAAVTEIRMPDASATSFVVIGESLAGQETTIEGFRVSTAADRGFLLYFAESGRVTVRDCLFQDSIVQVIQSHTVDLRMENCDFVNCEAQSVFASCLYHYGNGEIAILGCDFVDCNPRPLRIEAFGTTRPVLIENTTFVRCSSSSFGGAAALDARPGGLTVRSCTFQECFSGSHAGALIVSGSGSSVIEDCVFVGNRVTESRIAGALYLAGDGLRTVRQSTFYENSQENLGAGGTAVAFLHDGVGELTGNVIAACRGSAAVRGGADTEIRSSCNIFWNNEFGEEGIGYSLGPVDRVVDPQLCDPEAGVLAVAESSPCLPGNHLEECAGQIGAFGVGCPSTGTWPVGLRTLPDDLALVVDGVDRASPWLETWPTGSSHEVAVPPSPIQPSSDARYTFDSWSDGGSETHTVVGVDSYVEYAANFNAEYWLTIVAEPGGTSAPSEWVARGDSRELLAVPDSAWTFMSWQGEGSGSYTGPDNPITVTLLNPIVQRAIFRNDAPLLTMQAQGGGSVTPESARRTLYSTVPIEGFPDAGWAFSHWVGVGQGSYSGSSNPASVTMNGPITQTAVFVGATPLLTMNVVGGGSTAPPTGPQSVFQPLQILATPDLGWEFQSWTGTGSGSYSGINNPATVTMNEPLTQTANFVVGELPLTMLAEEGGAVTPESGDVTSFVDVEIEATPDPGYRFVQWKGQGDGSYTGTDNPATVTLSGPITQVAHFEPAAFSVTLSLSDTDPYVHTGGPIGLGNVHLWVTCGSTERGLQSIALKTAGSLRPLAFLPAPGVAATGTGTVLAGIDGCPDGPVRLGRFLVNSPGGGSLCLDASGAVSGLTITDCEGATYSWPENVGFVGVHTGGGQPCGGGSGCEAIDAFAAPVGAPDVAAPPSATRLAGIFPTPFGSGTTIHFDVERPMDVRLTVFDVSGRQVKVLRHGSVPAGRHATGWDGRDSNGQAVAAGVYFVRLIGDGVEQAEKVTVVRGRP